MTDSRENCPDGWDAAELLAYMEGELNPAEARKLGEHLRTCVVCSDELESLRRFDLLLKRHPESFHPEKEELYRFASTGEGVQGQVEAHIQSCPRCREDLELLREMIALRESGDVSPTELPAALAQEFERIHGTGGQVERPTGRLHAWWSRLLEIPNSLPVLALGTAAAVLIIAVFAVPLWKSYVGPPISESTGVPVGPVRKPAELSSEIRQAAPRLEEAAPGAAQELRKYNALRKRTEEQEPKVGGKRVGDRLESAKSDQPATLEGRVSEGAPAGFAQPPKETALPAAPVPEPKRERESLATPSTSVPGKQQGSRGDHDKVSRIGEVDRRQKSEKKIHAAKPAQGLADVMTKTPVEVWIIDSQGLDLERIEFIPPADPRYSFHRGAPESTKAKAPAKPHPAASKDRKAGERIIIKVSGEGKEHDLEGQLFYEDSATPEKTVKIERVSKDVLTGSIQDLVSSLIAGRPDVHEPDRPGN